MEDKVLLSLLHTFRSKYELKSTIDNTMKYNNDVFFSIMENIQKHDLGFNLEESVIQEIKKKIDSEFQIYQPDGIALLDDYDHEQNWYSDRKAELTGIYWDRYRKHLFDNGWTTEVLNKLENNTLDKIMNYLGDPNVNEAFNRKGLVMGDVQSGKTSNYIGLINKAVDAGYKVIILLTGTLESLRKQTQVRVEEGFIGYNANSKEWVGVGKDRGEETIIPHSLTSRENDFTGISGETTSLRINKDSKVPLVFVTKKNATTLKKIRTTISNINIVPPNKCINSSLLIIDDEADNASVNTNDSAYDPTKINTEIRELLKLFTKRNYVGFTATPFANVFIDPDSVTQMLEDDLFPKDFIYVLSPPSNYYGAERIFLDGNLNCIQIIDDYTDYFPVKHKIDWSGTEVFPSLIEAINCFLISNAIRDLRENSRKNSHRSMLINVSRFINVQNIIYEIVSNLVEHIIISVRHTSNLHFEQYIKNEYILKLYEVYQKHYSDNYDWNTVFGKLYDAIKSVKIFKVPSKDKNKQLDYDKHKTDGLRCIVIGGLALSRGLTLEGLTISYLYRNTSTFDVLMQMGRWFGYRNKPEEYGDLCKVWMLEQTNTYFIEITNSIKQLKDDLKQLVVSKKTPREFGIRVRNESETLGITSRSKMRNTKKVIYSYDLYGNVFETPFVSSNLKHITENMKAIESFITNEMFSLDEKVYIKRGVDKDKIINLLSSLHIHDANRITYFEKDNIIKFINRLENKEFDVVIINGKSDKKYRIGNVQLKPIERSFDLLDDDTIRIGGKHRRLGGKSDTKHGLTKEQISSISDLEKAYNTTYMIEGRNPLLLIYPLSLKNSSQSKDEINYSLEEQDLVNRIADELNAKELFPFGLGIGFPQNSNAKNINKESYIVAEGTKWWTLMNIKDNEEDE